ncbi:hypothetical protein [Zunongwangia sp. H14]
MKTLENITGLREGDLTHKRPFMNIRQTANRDLWYSRRMYKA